MAEPIEHPIRALIVIGLVLVGVPWTFKLASPASVGDSCEGGFDCAVFSGRCVDGADGPYCTEVCSGDSECPSSGHCGIPPDDIDRVQAAEGPRREQVCVPGPRRDQAPSSSASSRP